MCSDCDSVGVVTSQLPIILHKHSQYMDHNLLQISAIATAPSAISLLEAFHYLFDSVIFRNVGAAKRLEAIFKSILKVCLFVPTTHPNFILRGELRTKKKNENFEKKFQNYSKNFKKMGRGCFFNI